MTQTTAPSPERTLRRLFLTLFLRGRGIRGFQGMRQQKPAEIGPASIGKRLWVVLGLNALFGLLILMLVKQPVFPVSMYAHGMTLIFVGMFVASSAGEVLFNKEEADILLHRPISPRTLLWAKVAVLVQVSLWLAGAFNVATFFVGVNAPDGGLAFIPAHALSTLMEALFCTSLVVLTYQLCLRWFGRERLEGLMTTVQVIFSIALVLAGQIVPRIMSTAEGAIKTQLDRWWMQLLPPAWFAGIDDAIAGSGRPESLVLAGVAVLSTGAVMWTAFGRLANDYGSGLQVLGEAKQMRPRRAGRRFIDVLVHAPPLKWILGDSITRASFLLVSSYLVRDRDVKLRVYPSLAPMVVVPLVLMLPRSGRSTDGMGFEFGILFSSVYLCLLPLTAIGLLEHSQQFQASDLFRISPTHGPGKLSAGVRRAMLTFLSVPALFVFAGLSLAMGAQPQQLLLLLPGAIAMPVFGLVPCLGGRGVPFALPVETSEASKRPLQNLGYMLLAMMLAGIAMWSWRTGWFQWLIVGELALTLVLVYELGSQVAEARWPPTE